MAVGKGKPLELAFARAAKAYRREGRAYLARQYPPVSVGHDGTLGYTDKAPIDFLGVADGKAVAIEAKSCEGTSWPTSLLRDDQRDALDAFHKAGGSAQMVLSFDRCAETYLVTWERLAAFLERPWRESLTRTWCRAYGLLVPEPDRDDPSRRKTMFLDAVAHPEAAEALIAVTEERQRAEANRISCTVQEIDEAPPAFKPSAYVGLTAEQRAERIRAACLEGVDRQMKARRVVWRGSRR